MGGGGSKSVSIYQINPNFNAAWFYGCTSGKYSNTISYQDRKNKTQTRDVKGKTFNEFMDTYGDIFASKFPNGKAPRFYEKVTELKEGGAYVEQCKTFIPSDQLIRPEINVNGKTEKVTVENSNLGVYLDDIPEFDPVSGKLPIYGYIPVTVKPLTEYETNEKQIQTANPSYTEQDIITVGKDSIEEWMKILNDDNVVDFYLTHLANMLNSSPECALDFSIYEQFKTKLQELGKSETYYENPLGAVMVSNPSSLALSFRNILSQYQMELLDKTDPRSVSRKLIPSAELNYYWDILSNDLAQDGAIISNENSKDVLTVLLPANSKTVTTLGQIENTMSGINFASILSIEEAIGTAECVTPLIISSSTDFLSDPVYKASFNEAVDPKTSSPFIINVPRIEIKQINNGVELNVTIVPMHVYYRQDKLQSVERGTTNSNKEYLKVSYVPSNFSVSASFMKIDSRFIQ